jgi:hypothetical protein
VSPKNIKQTRRLYSQDASEKHHLKFEKDVQSPSHVSEPAKDGIESESTVAQTLAPNRTFALERVKAIYRPAKYDANKAVASEIGSGELLPSSLAFLVPF